jgi:glutamyl-tRNA reductase
MAVLFLGTDFREARALDLGLLETHASQIRVILARNQEFSAGAVVLATCNRFEMYLDSVNFPDAVAKARAAITEALGEPGTAIANRLEIRTGDDVVQRLFSVASGLESMVIGEGEISGQVKRALFEAEQLQSTSPEIQRLFQSAFRVSKQVASQTGLGVSVRSIIGEAIKQAAVRMDDLADTKVLLIGTGSYARVATAALRLSKATEISVHSRSGRAQRFAKLHNLVAVTEDGLLSALVGADLVVGASGRQGFVISLEMALAAQAIRVSLNAPTQIFIDVALARDVEPAVAQIPGCDLIDLETLAKLEDSGYEEELAQAQNIILDSIMNYNQSKLERGVDPIISALRQEFGNLVRDEVAAVKRRSGEQAALDVERSLSRVTNAILHKPLVKAKTMARTGNHNDYVQAVKLLYSIDLTTND